ncbi:SHOCT domain-containing protein [Tsuneonella suprasediminis]|nr:SHOCT domain-containing protein [Tsuneonella suprasediminis]
MTKHIFCAAISSSILCMSTAAIAGPDEDMRDAARAEASKLRAEGWPKERCYAGVSLFNNVVTEGNGTILAGDELLYIGDTSVEKATTDEIAKTLSSTPPNGTITVQVRRNGQVQNATQKCGNLADYQRPYLEALDFAANKKWYECIDALASRPDDPFYLNLRVRCARVSRKAAEYPIQQWMDKGYRRSIAMGVYMPDSWFGIATSLLKGRYDVSPSVYDSLVDQVKGWDDGKTWASVQPDYTAMRRAAEKGVKLRLIDPQSAIIDMPYDFIYGSWSPAFTGTRFEGFMTCGTVNAKNRMGGYTGSTFFISVIDEAGFEKYTDMDSSASKYIRPVDNACSQLVKKLKYFDEQSEATVDAPSSNAGKPSMAQELEKLAALRASGALSDEEYAAAKARVLSGS